MPDSSDKKGQRLVFNLQGEKLFEILVKRINDGFFLKPLIGEENTHQHVYETEKGIEHHITHEGPKNHDPQRHTQRGVINNEKLIRMNLAGFCPDGVTPPTIANLEDQREIRKLVTWLNDMAPRIIHMPSHRRLKRPIGEMAKLWGLFSSVDEGKNVAIDPLKDFRSEDWEDDRLWEAIMEDEMRSPDRTLAFTEDESRMILLADDGFVIELNLRLAREYQEAFFKEIGTDNYLESSITGERLAEALRKIHGT